MKTDSIESYIQRTELKRVAQWHHSNYGTCLQAVLHLLSQIVVECITHMCLSISISPHNHLFLPNMLSSVSNSFFECWYIKLNVVDIFICSRPAIPLVELIAYCPYDDCLLNTQILVYLISFDFFYLSVHLTRR